MISAPNLLPPLSGNKTLAVLLCLLPLLLSCELFKKAQSDSSPVKTGDELEPIQGRRVYDPETGTYVIIQAAPTEKMDTVFWKDLPSSSFPSITSEAVAGTDESLPGVVRTDEIGSEFLTAYNVAVILPFLTDRFNVASASVPDNALWALNFYGGLRMALDELTEEGIRLNVSVHDSKADDNTTSNLLRSNADILNAHAIIGPYRRDNAALAAEYAKRNGKVFISPYSATSDVSSNNPNYVQVNPTLQTHCEAIVRHALKNYRPDQIVLVSRDKPAEVARFQYFHDEYFRLVGTRTTTKFREFIIADGSADLGNVNVMPFIELSDTTVFIIPNWSDETFLISFLRKVELARGTSRHIAVYGMPQWMSMERIDFDYFEKLNVHVSSSVFIDPLATDVQFFKRKFFQRFGAVPREEAYLGYDVMRYCGQMLKNHGTKFQYSLEKEPIQALHTRFEFERVVTPTTTGLETPPVQRWENKYLNILRFREYQFQLAN
jgi:hypothetical protein